MGLFLRILPFVLISFMVYVLAYQIYPEYQKTLDLVKQFNGLNIKKEKIEEMEQALNNLSSNQTIRSLMSIRNTLNSFIPPNPNIENILASLNTIYINNGLLFEGTNFNISDEPKILNSNVLPLRSITFDLKFESDYDNLAPVLLNIINNIERNVRLMKINKADINKEGGKLKMDLKVESYYMIDQKLNIK